MVPEAPEDEIATLLQRAGQVALAIYLLREVELQMLVGRWAEVRLEVLLLLVHKLKTIVFILDLEEREILTIPIKNTEMVGADRMDGIIPENIEQTVIRVQL